MTKNQTPARNITFDSRLLAASLIALTAVLAAPAASAASIPVTLSATNDAGTGGNGRTSFGGLTVGSTNWAAATGLAASSPVTAGYAYEVAAGRIIQSTSASYTFVGDSLNLKGSFYLRGADGTTQNVGTAMSTDGGAYIADANATANTQTLAGTISINSGSLTLDGGGSNRTMAVSAGMSGVGSVTVQSSAAGGVVRFSSAKTYSGDTTIGTNGLLQMGFAGTGAAAATGTGDVIIGSTGTLSLAGNNTTINGLFGSGVVNNVPAAGGSATNATLTLWGDNTSGGTNNVFSGSITNGTGGGVLSLVKSGTATRQTLSGTNGYTGTTTISAGQLQFSGANSLVGGKVTVSGAGTLELNNVGAKSQSLDLTGRATDTFHVNNVAGGNTLSAAGNTITLINGGVGANNFNLTTSAGSLGISGGINGSVLTDLGARNLNLSAASSTSGTVTGAVTMSTGTGITNTLNKTDAGTWTLTGPVTGLTTLNVAGGTLALGSGISVAGDMAVNGVGTTLKLGGTSASAKGLTGTGGTLSGSDSGALNLTIGVGATVADPKAFGGIIANGTGGAVSLTKTGDNTQILSGANTYTGQTTISGGTLQIQNGSGLGGGTGAGTTVQGTGTLGLFSGTGITSAEAITIEGRANGIGTDPAPINAHINNLDGDNTLSGGLALGNSAATTENYNIVSSADELTISGPGITRGANLETNNLNLGGAGNGEVTGVINMGTGGTNNINKVGDGTWTLSNTTPNTTNINAKAGTLVFNNAGIAYSGTATIDSGATLKQGVEHAFDGKKIQVNGALDLNGNTASLPGLNGLSSGSVVNSGSGTQRLTITDTGNFAGIVSGAVQLKMNGSGKTQTLSGANTYTGGTIIADGTVKVAAGGSLGSGAVSIVGTDPGTLELSNAGKLTNAMTLTGRNVANAHVLNSSGTNELAGVITLADSDVSANTPDNYILSAATGTVLNITGEIQGSPGTNGPRNLNLGGAGDGSVVKVTMAGSAVDTLNKDGSGTWTLKGAVTGVEEIKANGGTLAIGAGAVVSSVGKLFVASGATIDAKDVVSDFNIVTGQTLYGAGAVKAPSDGKDVVAQSGSTVDIGNGLHTDIATLSIFGDMTLAADSLIQINLDPTGGAASDLLAVSKILTVLDHAKLTFFMSSPLTALVYRFASYDSLVGDPLIGFDVTGGAPTGYHIDYAYNDHYVALVSDIPAPAPLFLMGLGALIMGAGRRYAKW